MRALEDSTHDAPLRQTRGGYDLALRVVPLEQVVPHEHFHERRAAELTARLVADGRLINPPIVAQQGEKYVVLDGATRLTAMRQLRCPYIVVQVDVLDLDIGSGRTVHRIELSSWNHVVYGGASERLLAALVTISGLEVVPGPGEEWAGEELPAGAAAQLITVTGEHFILRSHADAMQDRWLHVLNEVVACYGQWGNVERTLSYDLPQLASQFEDFAALVTFPRFTPQAILALAEAGRTVPAGITRFVIPGRILRLNVPLAKLAEDEPLAAKQAWLDALLHEKLRGRQVRFYEEPVVLLDE